MRPAGFVPPRLLRHAHIQSALASSGLRRRRVQEAARAVDPRTEDVVIDCDGGVQLLGQITLPTASPRRTAVILHGWEGSTESFYMLSATSRLLQEGYRVVRINFRDHGQSHHLNQEMFHSCRLAEMVDAVRWVRARYPTDPLHLGGFSLGGNFAMRIAATAGRQLELASVAAICPLLEPAETLIALDRGLAMYRYYFLQKWRRSLERKAAAFPHVYDFGPLRRFRTLTDMTEHFVVNYTEFPTLESYLHSYALTGERLAALEVPSRMLLAEDDPVIPIAGLARVARSPLLQVDVSRYGGHCGFLVDYRMTSWMDDYLAAAFGADADLSAGHRFDPDLRRELSGSRS